jgi:hypothetical protein
VSADDIEAAIGDAAARSAFRHRRRAPRAEPAPGLDAGAETRGVILPRRRRRFALKDPAFGPISQRGQCITGADEALFIT